MAWQVGLVWFGMVWCGVEWYDTVQRGIVTTWTRSTRSRLSVVMATAQRVQTISPQGTKKDSAPHAPPRLVPHLQAAAKRWEALQKRLEAVQRRRRDRERETSRRMNRHAQARERRTVR